MGEEEDWDIDESHILNKNVVNLQSKYEKNMAIDICNVDPYLNNGNKEGDLRDTEASTKINAESDRAHSEKDLNGQKLGKNKQLLSNNKTTITKKKKSKKRLMMNV